MNLKDISPTATPKKMNRIIESRFGFSIDYNNLTVSKATKLSATITENINRIRKSFGAHTAEKNPRYMELIMVREALGKWLNETRVLRESEMGKSEAILAAKDMVNSIQDMLEKVSKMQVEQLPALVDTIRDQISMEQADQYKANLGELLTGMVEQLTQARERADGAVRSLTGEAPAGDMAMQAPGQSGSNPQEPAQSEVDNFAATDAAAGGAEPMGREIR
jgi:hypothetical protein